MHLAGVWLQSFRNFDDQQWSFSPGMNVFTADNGSGKSNLIEAIALLSTGQSWRARQTSELIKWGDELARVQAKVILQNDESIKLEQIYTHGQLQGKKTNKRLYKANGVNRAAKTALGQLLTVVFTPEDMDVFGGGGAERRRLLDNLLDQVHPQYRYARKQYEQALRRRNKLLSKLREREATRQEFFVWDRMLIEHGTHMHDKRREFLDWLDQQPGVKEEYQIEYDHSVISEARLKQYEHAEVGAGYTLVGPHKEDVIVKVKRAGDWRSIERFGSRGEQRLALAWWKLQEVQYMQQQRDEMPVLLLDDVFSELDEHNQEIIEAAAQRGQAIITTVETGYDPLVG